MNRMFRAAAGLLLVLVLLLFSLAALAEAQPSLSMETEATVFKGKTLRLAVTLEGSTERTRYDWASSAPEIASVVNGNVNGREAGEADITCTAVLADGTELSAVCHVTVRVAVANIRAENPNINAFVGRETDAPAVVILPEDASDPTVAWVSSDESVLKVDPASGRLTGVAPGRAFVTAEAQDGSGKSCRINVSVLQAVEEIVFAEAPAEIAKGKSLKLEAFVLPENASNQRLNWFSSDPDVAAVQNGNVTGKNPGTAVITATAADGSGVEVSREVEVFNPVASLAFPNRNETVLMETEGLTLTVTVLPEDAKYRSVSWSVSDETIATIDQAGHLTPLRAGKVTVTARSEDKIDERTKPKEASCTVEVIQPVKELHITDGNFSLAKGKNAGLQVQVLPEDATNPKLAWESSDPKIVTVGASGSVRATGVGTATVTCTATDGSGVTASCEVTVFQEVTAIRAENAKVVLTKGDRATLKAQVSPVDASNKILHWSSESPSIASVDPDTGVVTGQAVGSCVIVATSTDGSNRSAKMTVIVEPVIPLDATTLTRSGYFGMYYEFAVTFKNLTKTRTIKYIKFTLQYDYQGSTYRESFYTNSDTLGAGKTKKIGWWDMGYKLSYCSNFRLYLTNVRYADGTSQSFSDDNLIGWF